jgi:septal ring factor EnvC (AmiA/AmiB activator)
LVSRRRRFGGGLSGPSGRASRGMTVEHGYGCRTTRSLTALPETPALVLALEAHIATLKTDIERLTTELAGERAELAGERVARQTDQEQLAAARAAADKATAELVELARRLAVIAETQAAAETAETEPEPPQRSKLGRAWGWFLRN